MMRFYVPAVLLLSLVLMISGEAQIKSGARASASLDNAGFAQASNVAITVAVDRHSGQFAVRTKKGVPLLFFQGDNATSFANVRLGSTVFTNNDLHRPQPPLGTTRMPAGIAREEGDSVVFVAVLHAGGDSVSLRMDFVPMLESDYAFVRVRTSVRNLGARVLDAGFLLMLDVFLEHSDLVSLAVQSDTVRLEREWFGDAIPDQWHGRVAGSPIVVRGRLRGGGTDAPSRFVAGQWQDNGYLGAAAWDYRASGLRIWDAAVLSQWDQRALAPGASFTIETDYGYLADFDAALVCGAERVAVNAAQNAYTPDPFTVSAVVRSTGSLPLPSWSLSIGVPPGARLAAGENQTHSSSVPLFPGDSVRVAWRFHADATDTLRVLSFPIDLTDPAQEAQRCTAETRIPPMPRFEAALSCPDTLSLNLNADSSAYDPTTIPLTVTVRNTGTAVLSSLTATITVPPELKRVGGAASMPIAPITLAPGATGSAGWVLEALPRSKAALVQVSVIVSGAGLDTLRCTSHISIPAIIPKQICTDSAATIRGREFWLAFPPNNGSGTLTLRVFASAVEAARVTITRGWLGRSNDITVPAGGTAYFDVEESAQEILPETPVKRGVFVRSDRPVSITIASLVENHSDASLVLPLHALGTSYHAAGYNYSTTDEQFVVVATEDATSVTITPFGLTSTRRPPRVPFQVTLQQGDCYRVQSGITGAFGGLTGSFIVADKPVTVFGGAQSGWIPENSLPNYGFLNHHAEQLPPDDFLGKEFLAMPFLSRRRGDTYKVVATADSTDVTIGTDAPVRLAQRGDWMEFQRAETAVITASKPVSVAQFANSAAWDDPSNEYGDASMTIMVPSNRFSACHVVNSGVLDSATSFLNLTVHEGGESAVVIDGVPLPDTAFHRVPLTTLRAARLAVSNTTHSVETSDPRGVGVTAYGFSYHDAYSFNAGYRTNRGPRVTGLTDPAAPTDGGFAALPNPSSGVVRFYIPSDVEDGELVLYDLHDRRVAAIPVGRSLRGTWTGELNLRDVPVGMYVAMLQTRIGTRTLRVLRTR
ncbi:MAG: T9SS type A sorting domain-containing protein [Ignavibacteriae bacterium]|nr:T9SS type A sorting domain-containing protein [Ignavibacteriota bacterium]